MEKALGFGSVAEANVGEGKALLEREKSVLVHRRESDGLVVGRLEIFFGRFGVIGNQRDHAARGVEPDQKIGARLGDVGEFGFLLGEDGAGEVERSGLIAAGFERSALKFDDHGVLRQGAVGLDEESGGAIVFLASVGIIGARVERAGDGVMQLGGNQRLCSELSIDGGRGALDGVEQALVGFAALEGIAAAEEIAGEEAVDGRGDLSLAAGNVAGAGGAAIEDETGAEAEDEGDDGDDDPGAAGAGVGEFALGDLCALLGEFDAVALDPAGVKIFEAGDEIGDAFDAKDGIATGGVGDVVAQERIVDAGLPPGGERLTEVADHELIQDYAEGIDVG